MSTDTLSRSLHKVTGIAYQPVNSPTSRRGKSPDGGIRKCSHGILDLKTREAMYSRIKGSCSTVGDDQNSEYTYPSPVLTLVNRTYFGLATIMDYCNAPALWKTGNSRAITRNKTITARTNSSSGSNNRTNNSRRR